MMRLRCVGAPIERTADIPYVVSITRPVGKSVWERNSVMPGPLWMEEGQFIWWAMMAGETAQKSCHTTDTRPGPHLLQT